MALIPSESSSLSFPPKLLPQNLAFPIPSHVGVWKENFLWYEQIMEKYKYVIICPDGTRDVSDEEYEQEYIYKHIYVHI